jgi:hypothetical protein
MHGLTHIELSGREAVQSAIFNGRFWRDPADPK